MCDTSQDASYNTATYHQAIIIQLGGNSEQFQTPTVQALRSREIIWIEPDQYLCQRKCNVQCGCSHFLMSANGSADIKMSCIINHNAPITLSREQSNFTTNDLDILSTRYAFALKKTRQDGLKMA